MDENNRNPTIAEVKYKSSKNHFVIKYKTEEIRINFVNMIMKLINKHEIKDFHIEEKRAFLENRILYNFQSLTTKKDIHFEQLDKNFLKYFAVL